MVYGHPRSEGGSGPFPFVLFALHYQRFFRPGLLALEPPL